MERLQNLQEFLVRNTNTLTSICGGAADAAPDSGSSKKKDVDSTSQDSASGDHYDTPKASLFLS